MERNSKGNVQVHIEWNDQDTHLSQRSILEEAQQVQAKTQVQETQQVQVQEKEKETLSILKQSRLEAAFLSIVTLEIKDIVTVLRLPLVSKKAASSLMFLRLANGYQYGEYGQGQAVHQLEIVPNAQTLVIAGVVRNSFLYDPLKEKYFLKDERELTEQDHEKYLKRIGVHSVEDRIVYGAKDAMNPQIKSVRLVRFSWIDFHFFCTLTDQTVWNKVTRLEISFEGTPLRIGPRDLVQFGDVSMRHALFVPLKYKEGNFPLTFGWGRPIPYNEPDSPFEWSSIDLGFFPALKDLVIDISWNEIPIVSIPKDHGLEHVIVIMNQYSLENNSRLGYLFKIFIRHFLSRKTDIKKQFYVMVYHKEDLETLSKGFIEYWRESVESILFDMRKFESYDKRLFKELYEQAKQVTCFRLVPIVGRDMRGIDDNFPFELQEYYDKYS